MDTKIIPGDEKSHNEMKLFDIVWQGIPISIKWDPEYHSGIIAHIEIKTKNSVRIPITSTGYKSHFCDKQRVIDHGGPVSYIRKCLEQEALSSEWVSYQKSKNIQTLF